MKLDTSNTYLRHTLRLRRPRRPPADWRRRSRRITCGTLTSRCPSRATCHLLDPRHRSIV